MAKLNKRSLTNLEGVHEDLVKVVMLASKKASFLVTEGVRSRERQARLVAAGKSQTRNSRHLYGLAVDLCDTDGCYDVEDMRQIAQAVKDAAKALSVPIVWGGDWKRFIDTPHFELDRRVYPDKGDRKPWALKPSDPGNAVAIGGGAGAVGTVAAPSLPALPDITSHVGMIQTAAETLAAFVKSPVLGVALLLAGLYYVAAPKLLKRFAP